MRQVVGTLAAAMLAVQGAVVDVARAQASRIEVDGAWTTVLPPAVKSAEVYMVIRNTGEVADRLMGARSSACGRVRVYESTQTTMSGHSGMGKQSGMGKPSGTGSMAMMGMSPVSSPVNVGAGAQVELKPGGLHLMCMDRTTAFVAGRVVPVMLTFERAGDVTVSVTVREPGAPR